MKADSAAPKIALAHDYLTQRGGAERVVLSMMKAFPGAPLYASLYEPTGTFPEFRRADIHPLGLNRLGLLRQNHRLALPLLAWTFSRTDIPADVVLCSSSGWAHGIRTSGRKIVYCHTPARWLYQMSRYMPAGALSARAGVTMLRPYLLRWDRLAALKAHRYLTSSTAVRERIRAVYGLDADLLPPPFTIDRGGSQREPTGLDPGFFLVISRLLPYKNVGAVIDTFADLPGDRLVIVGTGPEERRLRRKASANVRFLGTVDDEELRWLYANAVGIVAASYEDYGLTPVEGASFGKPAAALRWGGFLDTVVEGVTGVFFDRPEPAEIRTALRRLRSTSWSPTTIETHAELYSEEKFVEGLRQVVAEEAGELGRGSLLTSSERNPP